MTLCLYAFVQSPPARLRVRGIRGEPLTLVHSHGLLAVVGQLRSAPAPSPRNLRAFHVTLEALWRVAPAILPVRFGTMMTGEELLTVAKSRAASLNEALRQVRGRAQMTVRFVVGRAVSPEAGRGFNPGDSPAGRAVTPGDSPVGRSFSPGLKRGTTYLRTRAALTRRMFPEQARLNDAVRRWVRQERVEERGGVLSVYHLVPRTAAGSYARAVSRAFADTAVVVTGPFPPFAFADPFERGASRRPSRSRRLAAPTHV